MEAQEYKIKLFKKQLEFVRAKEREVLFSGAMGSGKSVSGCVKLLTHAIIPNSFCILTRKTRESITNSTLRTLIVGEKDCPPILPTGSYEYLESKSQIKLYGGGTIIVIGCDNPLKIRSINASAIYVDEAVELDEEEWTALSSRLRNTADANRQLFGTTNPGSERHFLYSRFYASDDATRKVITVPLIDASGVKSNPRLPKDYIDAQLKLTGAAYKRYVQALWCSAEGLIYTEFDVNRHRVNHSREEFDEFVIGLDVGYSNDPTAICVFGKKDGKLHGIEEYYQSGTTPTAIVSKVEELSTKYNRAVVVIDPSAAGIRMELEGKSVPVVKGNNAILEGISRVKDLLVNDRLTFNANCVNAIKEFELYAWKEGTTDKPVGKFDHMLDLTRYVTAWLFDSADKYITPSVWTLSQEPQQDPMQRFVEED